MTAPRFPRLPEQFVFGVAYYPEHDLAEHLEEDVTRLRAAGVNTVRMAEFAWDLMEPSEGTFDFLLFETHVNRLGGAGIRTILCTPTATPPVWLTRKHPEILQVDANGRTMQHGSRQHASLCSPVYREYSRRITRAMAAHFAANPHVIGWQTDNEIYCHCSEDYSPAAQEAFRDFLREKYRRIDVLNNAWGTRFWSQTYKDFADITPPWPNRPAAENPGHRLDFLLFTTDKAVRFQRDQVEILRAANSHWWVTHNGVFRNLDYREFARDLDFMAVDVYPLLAFMDAPGEPSPATFPSRLLARTRSITGNFIVTELQSGAGGQADWMSVTPEPGQMRLFAWQAVAHGAMGILHFRWRTCRFGAEEYWEGILDHDNIPRRRYQELCDEGAEFRRLAGIMQATEVRPEVGVLFDMGGAELGHRPITHGLPSPWDVADGIYTAWARAGYNVGYVHPLAVPDDCRLLFLCSASIVSDEVVAALERWVERGGVLVILARSGTKDIHGRVRPDTPPGALTRLAGCVVDEHSKVNSPQLVGTPSLSFNWDKEIFPEHLWHEILVEHGGRAVARWQGGRFDGLPAIVENTFGRGLCLYVGTYASGPLMTRWLGRLAAAAHVRPIVPRPPEGVEVTRRVGPGGALIFLLNHTSETKTVSGPPAGKELVSDRVVDGATLALEPFGVAVIQTA